MVTKIYKAPVVGKNSRKTMALLRINESYDSFFDLI